MWLWWCNQQHWHLVWNETSNLWSIWLVITKRSHPFMANWARLCQYRTILHIHWSKRSQKKGRWSVVSLRFHWCLKYYIILPMHNHNIIHLDISLKNRTDTKCYSINKQTDKALLFRWFYVNDIFDKHWGILLLIIRGIILIIFMNFALYL